MPYNPSIEYFIEIRDALITCNVCIYKSLLRREQEWQVTEMTDHCGDMPKYYIALYVQLL